MLRSRLTIARCMSALAVLGLNLGLIRAYALAEAEGQGLFEVNFGFLILFALQFGLWRYLRTSGRRRRFWLGFVLSGFAATLGMGYLAPFAPNVCESYCDAMSELLYHCVPIEVDSFLENDHPTFWWAICFFVPEIVAGLFGGLLAACLFRNGRVEEADAGTPGDGPPGASATEPSVRTVSTCLPQSDPQGLTTRRVFFQSPDWKNSPMAWGNPSPDKLSNHSSSDSTSSSSSSSTSS